MIPYTTWVPHPPQNPCAPRVAADLPLPQKRDKQGDHTETDRETDHRERHSYPFLTHHLRSGPCGKPGGKPCRRPQSRCQRPGTRRREHTDVSMTPTTTMTPQLITCHIGELVGAGKPGPANSPPLSEAVQLSQP